RRARGGSSSTAITGWPVATRYCVISPWPAPISIQQKSFASPGTEKFELLRETPIARAIFSRHPASVKKCWPSLCRAIGRGSVSGSRMLPRTQRQRKSLCDSQGVLAWRNERAVQRQLWRWHLGRIKYALGFQIVKKLH